MENLEISENSAFPPVVDRETWLNERKALLAREKAHTREGHAIAAARRRLPMTEVKPAELIGPNGATPLLELLQGHDLQSSRQGIPPVPDSE